MLNIIINIWENIITNDLIFTLLTLLILIILVWLKYKNRQFKYYLKNIRFVWRLIVILIMTGVATILKFKYDELFQNHQYLLVIMILIVLYLFWRIEHVNLLTKIKLNKINNKINQGLALELNDLFDNKPFYIMSFIDNYRYNIARADYFTEKEKHLKAYNIYQSINKNILFPNEKHELYKKTAMLLYFLGDIWKMEHYITKLSKKDSVYYLLKSYFHEAKGDFEKEKDMLIKAKNNVQNNNKYRVIILNNYGRIRMIEGNLTDAKDYYLKALNYSKDIKKQSLIHVCYQNVADIYKLKGDSNEFNKIVEEYKNNIDLEKLKDIIEYSNFMINTARQSKSIIKLKKQIENYNGKIRNKLSLKEQLLFNINELRITYNAQLSSLKLLEEIKKSLNDYLSLSMPDKYLVFKEIMIVLENKKYAQEFPKLYQIVYNYLSESSENEIEEYLKSLPEVAVHKKCKMLSEKVIIKRKYGDLSNIFSDVYNIMVEIKDIYRDNGWHLNEFEYDLNIVDEALYWRKNEIMHKHLKIVEDNLGKLKEHPKSIEFYLRLAFYYLALNNKEKAKNYFNLFNKKDISILNYADWLQNYYHILKSDLKEVN